ncbi:hypothetical protein RRG08_025687 [Elysia crispata]|uniref:Uncharacterized protein n=1 Tax=Elysia crispata TaxID=231223 RepID=A0AAE1AYH0_9GAST|nr:hypothetical protein RRG08_025687 [Elysia crispata]
MFSRAKGAAALRELKTKSSATRLVSCRVVCKKKKCLGLSILLNRSGMSNQTNRQADNHTTCASHVSVYALGHEYRNGTVPALRGLTHERAHCATLPKHKIGVSLLGPPRQGWLGAQTALPGVSSRDCAC